MRGILWFHLLSALAVYLHTVTAINLSKGGMITVYDSLLFEFEISPNNISNGGGTNINSISNNNNKQTSNTNNDSYKNNNQIDDILKSASVNEIDIDTSNDYETSNNLKNELNSIETNEKSENSGNDRNYNDNKHET